MFALAFSRRLTDFAIFAPVVNPFMNQTTLLQARANRLNSIDFTRGLVIVIMALDHIRDLLHITSFSQDPVDLSTTTPALFMTRWVTHFCAPIFVFLAGVSAYLMGKSHNDLSKTRRFLLTRGLWLVFLEITVVGFGIWADIHFRTILLQVIFAIGMGFMILSALVKLPAKILGGAGLAIILLHDALPALSFPNNKTAEFLWSIFLQRGFFKLDDTHGLVIGYSIIPWLGIMLFGYGFGKVFEQTAEKRRRTLLIGGSIALLVFILFRALNLYGDPHPWSLQQSPVFSFLSFISVSKYPPSLLYAAVTLGIMFLVLFATEGINSGFTRFFITYGRVPMFFYLMHWYIVHISMFAIIIAQGASWQQMPFGLMNFGRPDGMGVTLPFVYLYWISMVLFMYPLCRWYGRYKAANRHKKWLAYL